MSQCTITVPSTQDLEEASEPGKTFTVYNIILTHTASGRSKSCNRRFHEFREFDKVWSELYPTVSERIKLPSSFAPIQTSSVINKRRQKLEEYLMALAEIKAIQPLLSQFIGVPEDWVCAPRGKPQENLPDLQIDKWRGMDDAKGKIHGLGRETQKASDAQHHGLQAIERDGETYFVSGASNQKAIVLDDMKVNKKEMRGNTHDASERARREKEAFLKKNAGVIASLMPGRNLNFAYNVDRTGEVNDRYMGKVLVSLWFRAGTGGNVRPPLKDDDFEDVGGGTIVIEIHSGMDLPSHDGITNPYCKLYLLPDPAKISKRKTEHKNRTVNPEWEEVFEYQGIYPTELPHHRLIVSIWDRRLNGKNSCVGEVCLIDLGNLPTNPTSKLSRWVDLRAWSNFSTPENQGVAITDMKTNQHDTPRNASSGHYFAKPQAVNPPLTPSSRQPTIPSAPPPSLPTRPPPKIQRVSPTGSLNEPTPTPPTSPTPIAPVSLPTPQPAATPAPRPGPPPMATTTPAPAPKSTPAPVSPPNPFGGGGGSLQDMLQKRKAEMDATKPATSTPSQPPQENPKPPSAPAISVAPLPPRPQSSSAQPKPTPPPMAAQSSPPQPKPTPPPVTSSTPSPSPSPAPAKHPTFEELIARRKAQVDAQGTVTTNAPSSPTPPPMTPQQSPAPPPMPKPATPAAPAAASPPPMTPQPSVTTSAPAPAVPTRRPAPGAPQSTLSSPTPPSASQSTPSSPTPPAPAANRPNFAQFTQFNNNPSSNTAPSGRTAPPPPGVAKVSLAQTTHAPAMVSTPIQAPAPQVTQSPVAEAPAAAASPPRPPAMASQQRDRFTVESEYSPSHEEVSSSGLLPLKVGEFVTAIDKNDPGWWYGRVGQREGYFPASFVRPC